MFENQIKVYLGQMCSVMSLCSWTYSSSN